MAFGPLVEADWLREHIDHRDVRVIDFRWYLQGRRGWQEFVHGHIPRAVFLDLEKVTGKDGGGRHPLPSADQFERELRLRGVNDDTKVVVYDDSGGSTAARLWFLLGYFGHRAQAVLNGGLQAWGGPLETEIHEVEAGGFRAAPPDTRRVLDFKAVREPRGVPLIDARAPAR